VTVKQLQKEIVDEFNRLDVAETGHFNLSTYLGTQNKLYHLKNEQERKLAKEFVNRHKDISDGQFLELLNGLYVGESFNERTFGTKLLNYKKGLRRLYTPEQVFSWLSGLSGWCEVDSLCQSTFSATDLLGDWPRWNKTLDKMSRDKNISRRRASLVLLCKAVRGCDDRRLADRAFDNIERLKEEKDILISKAVSWLLRSLIKHHKTRVSQFLADNQDALQKFVIKEVSNKIIYGTKTRR
jgi:3-methyladenine DNA glycosylase AlkD